jgi:hypothetical protein
MHVTTSSIRCAGLLLGIAGCGERATLPIKAGIGPNPTLPPAHHTLLPTVNIAPAEGWPAGDAGDKTSFSTTLIFYRASRGLNTPRPPRLRTCV